jgi:uncharacterized protein (DUF433 family)
MNRKVLIGIAGGALALALAGGAVLAGPSLVTRAGAAAVATAVPAGQNDGARNKGAQQGKAKRLVLLLGRATADVSGIKPKDVLAGLRDGKSLAQIAQEHGKSDKEIVAAARTKLQDALKQAVSNGRLPQARADAALAKFDQSAPQIVADTSLGQQIKRQIAKRHPVGAALVQATAQVTGLQSKDVVADLRAGKSLAQIAQEHGKSADDILAKLRELGQQRLDKGLDRAKELINKPGLGRGRQPNGASPTETAAPTAQP